MLLWTKIHNTNINYHRLVPSAFQPNSWKGNGTFSYFSYNCNCLNTFFFMYMSYVELSHVSVLFIYMVCFKANFLLRTIIILSYWTEDGTSLVNVENVSMFQLHVSFGCSVNICTKLRILFFFSFFLSEFELLGPQPYWFTLYQWRSEKRVARDVFDTFAP